MSGYDHTPNIPRSYLLADFPLAVSRSDLSIDRTMDNVLGRDNEQLTSLQALIRRRNTLSASLASSNAGNTNSSNNENKNQKRTITTVVSALKPTKYKDSDEKHSLLKSLSYITAQRRVLHFMDKEAADQLTPEKARAFTESIDTKYGHPSPTEALRLCYYMREHGFDTYARIAPSMKKEKRYKAENREDLRKRETEKQNGFMKNATMQLFVVNHRSNYRDDDYLYWEQDLTTSAVRNIRIPTLPDPNLQAPTVRANARRATIGAEADVQQLMNALTHPLPNHSSGPNVLQPVGLRGGFLRHSDPIQQIAHQEAAEQQDQVDEMERRNAQFELDQLQVQPQVLLASGEDTPQQIQDLLNRFLTVQATLAEADSDERTS